MESENRPVHAAIPIVKDRIILIDRLLDDIDHGYLNLQMIGDEEELTIIRLLLKEHKRELIRKWL